MEYSKSEVRELNNLIDDDLAILKHYTKTYIPDPLIGIKELCLADFAVKGLDAHLKCMKKYIIDTDNYNLAFEIEGKVTPVWGKYVEKVTNEDEIKRLRTTPGHLHFSSIRDTMLDWLDWIDEYEAEHPKQQDTPPERQSAGDEGANKNVFDKEKLKSLFIDDFSTKGYKVEETHNRSFKVSRFDKLCQRLEMVLEGNDKELMPTNKNIGAIAYMIYCSPYTIPEYQKPKREGERGKFAPLIRKVFDIVGMSKPSDTRANKYDEPTDDLRAMFEDILKRE